MGISIQIRGHFPLEIMEDKDCGTVILSTTRKKLSIVETIIQKLRRNKKHSQVKEN